MATLLLEDKKYIAQITGQYQQHPLAGDKRIKPSETSLKIEGSIIYYQETPRMDTEDINLEVNLTNEGIVQNNILYTYHYEPPQQFYREEKFLAEKMRFWAQPNWELEKIPNRFYSDEWCKDQDALQLFHERIINIKNQLRQSDKIKNTL